MKDGDPGSFANFFKNEPMTAAYLGYDSLADFRRLRFHPITLYWYIPFEAACSRRSTKTPTSIIQDRTDRSCFGSNLPELLSTYPIATKIKTREQRMINNGNRDHVYAGMFYRTFVNPFWTYGRGVYFGSGRVVHVFAEYLVPSWCCQRALERIQQRIDSWVLL